MPGAARGKGKDEIKTNHDCDKKTATDECSSDVFVNGVGVVRLGDLSKKHSYKKGKSCTPHQVPLKTASDTVIINGKRAGRKGDEYKDNEILSTGSGDVIFG